MTKWRPKSKKSECGDLNMTNLLLSTKKFWSQHYRTHVSRRPKDMSQKSDFLRAKPILARTRAGMGDMKILLLKTCSTAFVDVIWYLCHPFWANRNKSTTFWTFSILTSKKKIQFFCMQLFCWCHIRTTGTFFSLWLFCFLKIYLQLRKD